MARKKSSSWWRWIALLIVAATAAAWWLLRPAAKIEVVRPIVQTIQAYVDEQAVTELPHDFLIAMPIDGWLEPIELREGDRVDAGLIIARLETADLKDRVEQMVQRIGELETRLAEASQDRLEVSALVQAEATVKAIDEVVRAAETKLEASRAVYDFAEGESLRLKRLIETGSAAERELREADTELRRSRATYQGDLLDLAAYKTLAAVSYIGPKFVRDYIDLKSFDREAYGRQLASERAALEIARRNLARAEIASPVAGVVLARHQTRRQFLPAGTALLTIGRLEDIEITAEILTEQAVRIEPGDRVEIASDAIGFGDAARAPDSGQRGVAHGRVLRVEPAGFKKISSLGVEQQRVDVAIGPDAPLARVGVGFRVFVRIFYDEATGALTLPRQCVFRDRASQWRVIVVNRGRCEMRDVAVGLMNDEWVELRAGLAAGESVVLRPSREIVAGQRARPVQVAEFAGHPAAP